MLQFLQPRQGTDVDRDAVAKLFSELHYDVKVYNDLGRDDIELAIKNRTCYEKATYSTGLGVLRCAAD